MPPKSRPTRAVAARADPHNLANYHRPLPVAAPQQPRKALPKKKKGTSPAQSRPEKYHEDMEDPKTRAGKRKRTVTPEETNGRKKPKATKKATVQLEDVEEEDGLDSDGENEISVKTTKGKGKAKVEKKAAPKGKKPAKTKELTPVDDGAEDDEVEEVIKPAGGAKAAKTSRKLPQKRKKLKTRMDMIDHSLWIAVTNTGQRKATTKPSPGNSSITIPTLTSTAINSFYRRGGAREYVPEPDSENDQLPAASPHKKQGPDRSKPAQATTQQPEATSKRKRNEESPSPRPPKRPHNAQQGASDHASPSSNGLSEPKSDESLRKMQKKLEFTREDGQRSTERVTPGQGSDFERQGDEDHQPGPTPTSPQRAGPGQKLHPVNTSAPLRSDNRISSPARTPREDQLFQEDFGAQPRPASRPSPLTNPQPAPPASQNILDHTLPDAINLLDEQIQTLVQTVRKSRSSNRPIAWTMDASPTLQALYEFILGKEDWLAQAVSLTVFQKLPEDEFLRSLIWACLLKDLLSPEKETPWDSTDKMDALLVEFLSQATERAIVKLNKKAALTMLRDEDWQQRTLLFHTHVLTNKMMLTLTEHIYQIHGSWTREEVEPICKNALLLKGMVQASDEKVALDWYETGDRVGDQAKEVAITLKPGLVEIGDDGEDKLIAQAALRPSV